MFKNTKKVALKMLKKWYFYCQQWYLNTNSGVKMPKMAFEFFEMDH